MFFFFYCAAAPKGPPHPVLPDSFGLVSEFWGGGTLHGPSLVLHAYQEGSFTYDFIDGVLSSVFCGRFVREFCFLLTFSVSTQKAVRWLKLPFMPPFSRGSFWRAGQKVECSRGPQAFQSGV